MKFIIYHLDSLTNLALKGKNNNYFKKKKLNSNFISKTKNKSIFFENSYGYGETWSTTFEYFTDGNILENDADAFQSFKSFKGVHSIAKYFKKKNYTTILYRDQYDVPIKDFYKRYLDTLSKDFDFKCLYKRKKNYNFKNFLNDEKLLNKKFNKVMYLIHDYSLHDNPKAYYNPTENNYLSGIDISSKKFERNLKLVNYNSSKDILFFISDHGLNLYPYSKMHLDKKFTKESYNKYYLDLMSDVKLKTTFFFKYPRNKPAKISIPVKPKNVNQIIKILINKNYKKKLQNFYKIIRIKNNNILLSLRAADSDPYNNFVFKNLFHCHLLFIKKGKKISFSHNHPKKFYNHLTKKYIDYSDDFTYYINEYYSINEKIRKFLFYVISLIYRLLSKLLN